VITARRLGVNKRIAQAFALRGDRWTPLPDLPQPRRGQVRNVATATFRRRRLRAGRRRPVAHQPALVVCIRVLQRATCGVGPCHSGQCGTTRWVKEFPTRGLRRLSRCRCCPVWPPRRGRGLCQGCETGDRAGLGGRMRFLGCWGCWTRRGTDVGAVAVGGAAPARRRDYLAGR
jgi:hypothetical protein